MHRPHTVHCYRPAGTALELGLRRGDLAAGTLGTQSFYLSARDGHCLRITGLEGEKEGVVGGKQKEERYIGHRVSCARVGAQREGGDLGLENARGMWQIRA